MQSSSHDMTVLSPFPKGCPPSVDFTYRSRTGRWQPCAPLHEKTQSILEAAEGYLDVIHNNGSIAKHQGVALYNDRMEARINQSFTCNHPPIEQQEGNQEDEYAPLDWVDLINADIGRLSPSSDGKYRFNTGEVSVVISKEDRDTLCSTFTQRLLQTVEPEDLAEEKDARVNAAVNLIRMLADIDRVYSTIEQSLALLVKNSGEIKEQLLSLIPSKDQPEGRQYGNESMPVSPGEVGPDAELFGESPSSYSAANIAVLRGRDEESHFSEAPSTNRKTYKRRRQGGRWSNREKRNLSDYFQNKEGLSLQQKSDGYRRCYGSHRTLQSITKEAVRMGLDSTGNQRNKKIVKLKTSFNLKSSSNRIAVQSPIAPNAPPEHEGLCAEPSSEAQFRVSPTSSEAPDLNVVADQSDPVESTLNDHVDGQVAHTLESCPPSQSHEHSIRGSLNQLLN